MLIKLTTTIDIEPKAGGKSTIKGVMLDMKLPDGLDESAYYDEEGRPNPRGVQAISSTLIQGLLANIHGAHQNLTRDSAEHLRYVIGELERGFVALVKAE